jgi:hypothetical protein
MSGGGGYYSSFGHRRATKQDVSPRAELLHVQRLLQKYLATHEIGLAVAIGLAALSALALLSSS